MLITYSLLLSNDILDRNANYTLHITNTEYPYTQWLRFQGIAAVASSIT